MNDLTSDSLIEKLQAAKSEAITVHGQYNDGIDKAIDIIRAHESAKEPVSLTKCRNAIIQRNREINRMESGCFDDPWEELAKAVLDAAGVPYHD